MVVMVGTAASIVFIGGLARDPRIWMVLTGLTVVLGAQVAALPLGDYGRLATEPAWLLLAVLIIVCRWVPPRIARPRPANNRATIIGALVVLLGGVAVLTVDDQLDATDSLITVVYAVLGVLGASVRVVRLVEDFAHLAQTRLEARTDELTGLANRRALLLAMEQALASSRPTGLLIIDLDRFKEVNDKFGHTGGDRLLKHVGAVFAQVVPPTAVLARHGGDEFAVLLLDEAVAEGLPIARSLLTALTPQQDDLGRILQVGASVGVALTDEEDPRPDGSELLRRADAAMYLAKTSGTEVRLHDSELDAAARERRELIEDLHVALDAVPPHHEQIIVFFQPQLELATGKVCGAEALVRWQHPRRGLLAPDIFLDLTEQNGLMPALTALVMREATAQARRWHEAGFELRVSVNLSAGCLAEPALMGLIDEVLLDGIGPQHLVLEVTETSLMKDPDRALQVLRRIAERGVEISIDDYGTGYSSLSYMNDLPAAELKIDRSFTCRTVSDPRTAAIVAGTVELAHRLGMRLVVEGIEDVATLDVMAQLGCDESQGYLHSRPLPAEAFLLWLRQYRPQPERVPGPVQWASAP
jgi:diguanylate cyclase (GGDEF)-like protein